MWNVVQPLSSPSKPHHDFIKRAVYHNTDASALISSVIFAQYPKNEIVIYFKLRDEESLQTLKALNIPGLYQDTNQECMVTLQKLKHEAYLSSLMKLTCFDRQLFPLVSPLFINLTRAHNLYVEGRRRHDYKNDPVVIALREHVHQETQQPILSQFQAKKGSDYPHEEYTWEDFFAEEPESSEVLTRESPAAQSDELELTRTTPSSALHTFFSSLGMI